MGLHTQSLVVLFDTGYSPSAGISLPKLFILNFRDPWWSVFELCFPVFHRIVVLSKLPAVGSLLGEAQMWENLGDVLLRHVSSLQQATRAQGGNVERAWGDVDGVIIEDGEGHVSVLFRRAHHNGSVVSFSDGNFLVVLHVVAGSVLVPDLNTDITGDVPVTTVVGVWQQARGAWWH